MIKIKALNEAATNDTEDSFLNVISTEAQEQIASNEYNNALQHLLNDKLKEALTIFQDLIDTELLDKVLKSSSHERGCRPMLSLKYSCYKNMGNINDKLGQYQRALYYYWEASKLDDTDVMLWYRIGQIAFKMSNLELSCFAFAEGLKRNRNHWPCLDKIITILFAIPDYMNCLFYIFVALEKDSSYKKGLFFCQKILDDLSIYRNCYKNYYSNKLLDLSIDSQTDSYLRNAFMIEVDNISQKWIKTMKDKTVENINDFIIAKSIKQLSLIELGKTLLDTYNYIIDKNLNLIKLVKFKVLKQFESNYSAVPKTCDNDSNQTARQLLENGIDVLSPNVLKSKLGVCDLSHLNIKSKEKCISADAIKINEEKSQIVSDNLRNRKVQTSDSICYSKEKLFSKEVFENDEIYIKNVNNIFSDGDKFYENSDGLTEKEKANKVKKRRRSSLCFLTQWAWSSNTKRSSRIRTPFKKDYESDGAILEETLKQIFPSNLLPNNTKFSEDESWRNAYDSIEMFDDISVNKSVDHTDFDSNDENVSKPKHSTNRAHLHYFHSKQEELEVDNFIKKHSEKFNIIRIIQNYTELLSSKWSFQWPDNLSTIFIQLYLIVRQHVPVYTTYIRFTDDQLLEINTETVLLFCELYTDDWLCSNSSVSPFVNLNNTGIGLPSADLGCILFYNTLRDVQNDNNIKFSVRLMWLKANLFLYQGEPKKSSNTLQLLLQYMQIWQTDSSNLVVELCNCKFNSSISKQTVQNLLSSIKRSQKFHEIKYLYQEKNYQELICILKDTFHFPKELNQFVLSKEKPLERDEYLVIFLDSLCKLQQYEDCFVWAEVSLNEAWHHYLDSFSSCTDDEDCKKWLQVILHTLSKLSTCILEVDIFVVKYLSFTQRTRLVQNLIHILCHQLDVLGKSSNMPIDTVLPWILLHYILQYEEDKRRANATSVTKNELQSTAFFKVSEDDDDDDDDDIPASIVILLKGHKFLGRYGLCCLNNGKLLLFIMESLIPKLNFPSFAYIREKLKQPLEQAIYCLYGHPAKFISGVRSKPRHLDEHIKSTVTLTWEKSQLLFDFYKPENFPSFESRKNESINGDTVVLFKKICQLIPSNSDPVNKLEEMNAYLLGHRSVIPRVEKLLCNQISYIYYFIADHYFKAVSNNSWANAIKYYTLDLCLHPEEVNSWAGLAMSISTQMETWLNNFHPDINEEKYLMNAKISQRSYQHAVKLAPSNVTIWTEFGHFLYTVHSFCSRLLKQESDSLSMEKFKIFETQKEEMLDESKSCFLSANHIYISCQDVDEPQDDRWLYQYMLAKIAEKKKEEPPIFLSHYSKASQLLHENKAQYPKKIIHKNPQNLAVEALEVYYRVHASILKYLEQHEGKHLKRSLASVLEDNLKNCLHSPFANNDSTVNDYFTSSVCNNPKLVKENKFNIQSYKPSKHKRSFSNVEPYINNDFKKSKSDNISHLELMQDVVALTDELITKVCIKVSSEKSDSENHRKNSKFKLKYVESTADEPLEKKRKFQEFGEDLVIQKGNSKTEKQKFTSLNFDDGNTPEEWTNKETCMPNENGTDKLENQKNYTEKLCCRRDSQESTTTQTTSSESSSTSSGDTSTSDDSTNSSSSSDSDSDSNDSDTEKKKKNLVNEDSCASEDEIRRLIKYCLAGLEKCALRFPEHYKSIYRLAHFYFNNKTNYNILKCKQLLLESYACQFHQNMKIQGLFAERKNTNFFNGIWRIPIHDIDRPGSFASHMSKCVLLLMQVLKETNDSRMLFELCIQLRKIPDADKKYLRDKEREQLSVQALTLCLQCLRNRMKTMNVQEMSLANDNTTMDEKLNVLLDIYYTYQNMKNLHEYRLSELPKVEKLLEDAYIQYSVNLNQRIQGNVFDLAKDFCRMKLRASKTIASGNITSIARETNAILPLIVVNENINASEHTVDQDRKTQKIVNNEKNRVKTPLVTKSQQISSYRTNVLNNQFETEQTIPEATLSTNKKNVNDNLYTSSAFIEANILSSMLGSNFGVNIMDSAINYFNQVEIYQNILQQYQNSSTVLSSSMNYSNIISNHLMTQQPNISICNPKISLGDMKERPDISITPVVSGVNNLNERPITFLNTNTEKSNSLGTTMHISKSIKTMPSQQHFALNIDEKCILTPLPDDGKILATTAFKNKTGDQRFLPQSVHIGSTNERSIACTVNVNEMSLQHKLKKQVQRSYQSSEVIHLLGTGPSVKNLSPNFNTEKNRNISTNVSSTKSSTAIVGATSSKRPKGLYSSQKMKPKASSAHIPTKVFESTNKNHALSVLSHLQQHSHLEIIPQMEQVKNFSDKIPEKTKTSTQPRSLNIFNTDSISVYELPKRKLSDSQSSKSKTKKPFDQTSVEIITLDD